MARHQKRTHSAPSRTEAPETKSTSTEQQTSLVPVPKTAGLPAPMEGEEPPAPRLSPQQQKAADRLARGETVSKIAEEVGVDRGTIYRWRTGDPNFIAALNRWRGLLQAETRDRVLALSAGAADSVSKSIMNGDSRLGLRLLEKMGCLEPGPDHPTDPYAIFGGGVKDEVGRESVADGFRVIAQGMTLEQRGQSVQLLALGVAIDNQRAGRPTPPVILQMTGPVPQLARIERASVQITSPGTAPAMAEQSAISVGAAANDAGPSASVKASEPMRMKGRLVIDFDHG